MSECPGNECRFPPLRECRTATDWIYNFICDDEDYNLEAKCDGKYLTLKCVNGEGDETYNFKYYDPEIIMDELREKGRKNKEELEESFRDGSLSGKLKQKGYKRKKKKSKKRVIKTYKRNKRTKSRKKTRKKLKMGVKMSPTATPSVEDYKVGQEVMYTETDKPEQKAKIVRIHNLVPGEEPFIDIKLKSGKERQTILDRIRPI
tara:strand:- start:860 stop:1471 length:612 start_codon:yes stop_codon:yes gene_type:complete